jgi:hypothetical protein
MSARTFWILVVILALLAGGAYLQQQGKSRMPTAQDGLAPGDPLFPGLDVNQVREMLMQSGEAEARVARGDDAWAVTSLYGAPADFDKIADALRGLADLAGGDVMRGGRDFPEEFGLGPDDEPVRVTLAGPDGATLAEFSLGDRKAAGGGGMMGFDYGRYIQVADGPIALVDDPLDEFSAAAEDWIEKGLVSIPRHELDTVTSGRGADRIVLRVKGGNDYDVPSLATNETLRRAEASRLASALQSLRCTSIADPSLDDAALGFDAPHETEYVAANGRRIVARLGGEVGEDGARALRLSASFEQPPMPTREDAEAEVAAAEPDGDDERIDAKLAELEAAARERAQATREEIDALRERFRDRTFLIRSHAAESLSLDRNDLVEVAEPEEDAGEPPTDASGADD